MIETKEAVESIDEIMAVNGLDFILDWHRQSLERVS